MANSGSTTPTASTDPAALFQAELNSARSELRSLLTLINDLSTSVESIKDEMRRVSAAHPELLKDYLVPFSGISVMFYVGQRLSRTFPVVSSAEKETSELFTLLVNEYGANANGLDVVMKQNVLFYAAKAGSLTCCKTLVSLGCNAGLIDIHNQTALFYAAREGRVEVVDWLVKEGGCLINQLDRNGQTALFYAAREDKLDCVMHMVNSLGADPLIRDIFKKRPRAYLKAPTQKRTFDFLTEVEKARDPSASSSSRKLFIIRNEPLGAAAMTLRQHRPFNPHQAEEEMEVLAPPPPAKRQRSSGTTTPASRTTSSKVDKTIEKVEKVEKTEKPVPSRDVETTRKSTAASPLQSPVDPTPTNGRSRFRVRAPLGKGGLESFEKSFPDLALWVSGSPQPSPTHQSPTPPKTLTRPGRAPPAGLTPAWVSVVSLLLRGPLWRYGPATIFHKQMLQLPTNLGPKFQQPPGPEKKLGIDLSLIRKKLEKGKYVRLTEVDADVRSMFQQALELSGGGESDIGLLTKATEVYYDQQMAGSGLARVLRQEAQDLAQAARNNILTDATASPSNGPGSPMIQ